jgi:hypothetical protein
MDVDAKRDDTEAFEVRYGREDIDEAIDRLSLVLGSLKEGGALVGGAGGSKGKALLGGVMKDGEWYSTPYVIVSIYQEKCRRNHSLQCL